MKNNIQDLPSTIGKTSNCEEPNGDVIQWKIVSEIRKKEYDKKILLLQKMESQSNPKRKMIRFCYYMFNEEKNFWVFGQYAPFIDSNDFTYLIKEAIKEKWINL